MPHPRPTPLEGVLARVTARFPKWSGPLAAIARYSAFRGGQHAALIAFRGFLSIFPLLISLTTALDFLLQDRPELRDRIVDTAVGSVPVIGPELRVGHTRGSGLVLAFGLLGAAWAALAAIVALQDAYDDIWEVADRPNILLRRLRSAGGLALVCTSLAVAMSLSGLALGSDLPLAFLWALPASVAVNVAGVAASQVLLCRPVRFGQTWRGSILSGVLLSVLQVAGSFLVSEYLVGASATYGIFASVIALTSWFGLNAQVVLLGVCTDAERVAQALERVQGPA